MSVFQRVHLSEDAENEVFAEACYGVLSILLGTGIFLGVVSHEDTKHKALFQNMVAEALANNRLQLEIKTSDGTINLNTLSPKKRIAAVLNASKTDKTQAVSIIFSDSGKGYICTKTLDPKQLEQALDGVPSIGFNVEQASKYAEELGRSCRLSDEKIEAIKVNLIRTITGQASLPGPFSVTGNGVIMPQHEGKINAVSYIAKS